MDFDPDDAQRMIRDSAAKFFDKRCPRGAVLQMAERSGSCSDQLWTEMADLGWMGIPFPEEYGGMGMGFLELSMVLEEMGRVLLPGPYFASVVLGGLTVLLGGSEEQKRQWIPGIADGSLKATVALYEPDGRFLPSRYATRAVRSEDGFVLSGNKLFVLAGDEVGLIVCPATEEDGTVSLFLVNAGVDGMTRTRLPTLDITRPLSELKLDQVRVPFSHRLGKGGDGNIVLGHVADYAAVALGVEILGSAQRVLDLTFDYAKQRVQFGKPIGSFQAIKHKCADLHVRKVTLEAAARYAAWTADQALRGGDAPLAYTSSVAKTFAQQAYYRIAADAIQIHGGIGFTWEYELHLYLKRAKGVEAMFGDEAFHRERVMQLGGDQQ